MNHFSHIKYAGLSDVGRKRKNNEDAYGLFPKIGVFCVADGMGGGDDGEVASAATVHAVEMLAKSVPFRPNVAYSKESMIANLRNAIDSASYWVFKRAQERSLKGCGSTFVAVCLDATCPDSATAVHAGDSRLYRIRGRSIQQITKDHSAAELIGAKDENEINPMFRGMILRAVGIQAKVELAVTPFQVKQGDRILICSDGLSKMVPDRRIASIVKESGTLESAVKNLVDAANDAGGGDNITVVIVEVGKLPAALPMVELDAPQVNGEDDDVSTSDGNTVDTSSDTEGSFDFGSSTASGTSCQSGATGVTEHSNIEIPVEDSEEPGNQGHLQTEVSSADENGVLESSGTAGKRRIVWVSLVVVVVMSIMSLMTLCLWRNDGGGVGGNESPAVLTAGTDFSKSPINDEAERKREEEARRLAEECKREEEARRLAEERKREEEARRLAEERKREEEARRLAEERKREEEARRLAEERKRKELEEKIKAEKEKALMAQLSRKREVASAEIRRDAAFAVLRRVCEDKLAIAFVRKIQVIMDKRYVNDICPLFRPVLTATTREGSGKAAADLVKVMQPIVEWMVGYAEIYKNDVQAELNDPMTSADYRRKQREVPAKMDEFLLYAARVIGRDVNDPDVHMACAQIIEKVPMWF